MKAPIKKSSLFVAVAITTLTVLASPGQEQVPSVPVTDDEAVRELELANGLLERGLYRLAEKELRNHLDSRSDPDGDIQARLYLITALKEQGKNTEALQVIRKTRASDLSASRREQLNLIAGEIHFELSEYEKASRYFRMALSSENDVFRETALFFLGQCYARDGLDKNAIAVYRQLAYKDFDERYAYRPYAAYEMTELYRKQGNFEAAEKLYSKLVNADNVSPGLKKLTGVEAVEFAGEKGKLVKAEDFSAYVVENFPDSDAAVKTSEKLARLYLEDDQPDRALEAINTYQQQGRQEGSDYRLHYLRAAAFIRQQKFTDALTDLKEITKQAEKEGNVSERYRQLAVYQTVYCLLKVERYGEAVEIAGVFEDRFSDSPRFADVLFYRAVAFYKLDDFSAASEGFQRARKNVDEPGEWEFDRPSLEYLAQCYNEEGEYAKAGKVYQKLMLRAEENEKAELHLSTANAFERAGLRDKAKAEYASVLDIETSRPEERAEALNKLARLRVEESEFAEAEELLADELDEFESIPPRLQILLAYTQYQLEKYQDARERLYRLINAKNGEDIRDEIRARAEYLLVSILFEEKKTDEALEVFGNLFEKPAEVRPKLDKGLLLRIAELYFDRDDFSTCQAVLEEILPTDRRRLYYRATTLKGELFLVMNKRQKAVELLQNMIAEHRSEELKHPGTRDNAYSTSFDLSKAYSLLAEALLNEGRRDEAVYNFRRALQDQSASARTAARAYWGMARIFQKEKRWEKALSQAINGFILVDDPHYTPRCMLIAVKALVKTGEYQEAKTTWEELEKRFPAYAQQHKSSEIIKSIP